MDSGRIDPRKFDPIKVSRNFKVCSLDEINEYSVQLGWDIVYSQLGSGDYDAQYLEGISESLIVSKESLPVSLSLKTGGFEGHVALAIYLSPAPATMSGLEIQPDNFLIAMPGANVNLITRGPGELFVALLPEPEIENKLGDSYSTIKKSLGKLGAFSGDTNTEAMFFRRWFQNWSSNPDLNNEIEQTALTRRLHSIVNISLQNLAEKLHDSAGKSGTKFDVSQKRVFRLIDFFHSHPTEPLSVEDMSRLSGLGHRNLYYSFKKLTGYSPQQFFKNVRLSYLHRDLKSGAAVITTLALEYNFNHLGEFSAFYNKTYGELPSETLKKIRANASG